MSALIIVLHIIVCLILIFAVLLQSGKAADLAGAFGGGGSQTAFGGRGSASLLSKLTTAAAILFMLTSLGLWILSGKQGSSVVGGEKAPAKTAEKAVPPVAKPADKAGTEKKATPKTDPQKPPATGGTAEKK
ncbi:MAG: preprotein translocase subunit SecG [Candidatus Aminicenantes bacterium]|nr:preprotein translocase subunit SecG [Candidatus Aminicenantes bacterium]